MFLASFGISIFIEMSEDPVHALSPLDPGDPHAWWAFSKKRKRTSRAQRLFSFLREEVLRRLPRA